jgi:RNA polymerase sigma-B factor
VVTSEDRASRTREDRRLLVQYHEGGDPAARDALVERFLPLAQHLARRYRNSDGHAEDLLQVASIGLLNALDRFDPDRGVAFSSFAVPTILGEIKRYYRDKGWAVRVPRALQERALHAEWVADELESALGRTPTAAQIAERMGASVEQVLEARVAAGAHYGVSLDRPSGDDEDAPTLGDEIAVLDAGFDRAEDAMTFDRLLAGLSERQRMVLRMRFREDLTQSQIADRVGLSQMQVSRILRDAVEQLRSGREDRVPVRRSRL